MLAGVVVAIAYYIDIIHGNFFFREQGSVCSISSQGMG
jgi:hypothetical protein